MGERRRDWKTAICPVLLHGTPHQRQNCGHGIVFMSMAVDRAPQATVVSDKLTVFGGFSKSQRLNDVHSLYATASCPHAVYGVQR